MENIDGLESFNTIHGEYNFFSKNNHSIFAPSLIEDNMYVFQLSRQLSNRDYIRVPPLSCLMLPASGELHWQQ